MFQEMLAAGSGGSFTPPTHSDSYYHGSSSDFTIPKDYDVLLVFTLSGSANYTSGITVNGNTTTTTAWYKYNNVGDYYSICLFFNVKEGDKLNNPQTLGLRITGFYS